MKEINISTVIAAKRREKGVTQDELADYMGVSKASVSKWETGQSYPDITFLPRLAAYFNISIDELVGYLPQMTAEDIKKNYNRLAHEFSRRPFWEVYAECEELVKKYYSCFPLIFEIAALLFNHYPLAKEPEKQQEVLNKIIALCEHIKSDGEDIWLSKQANSMQALCYLGLQKPLEVLELLDGSFKPVMSTEVVLSSAYQMKGDFKKATMVMQVGVYQYLGIILGIAPSYLSLYMNDERFEPLLNRFLKLAEAFGFDALRPDLLAPIYYIAALTYSGKQDTEKTLEMLCGYEKVCTSDSFAVTLHGDKFFDQLDDWLEEFVLNKSVPRDIKVIREDVVNLIKKNPAFAFLAENPTYQKILSTLEANLG
ncbi:MAG TPA: helix-turn-helix transcriptional regulator [Oscillospiraceae bacterium]|nr:helix-turn-helix transcriptional regulator [Oscillospiraceae bacterium]HPF55907.1 helix-turn-helix transcriptional regulator [Clostridiales bacterium]HPK35239.1 helix-turn-helix transcriptional regulator [Oscillospiraceae bacterium]HPR75432.1 helix-turn-helix transcriptional regulator [Oscillospiraceae bacterium]